MPPSTTPIRIALVFGTRPEAVKLLPVIRELRAEPRIAARVVVTGQHRQMLDEILRPFGIAPDVDLDIMQPRQTLNDIVSRSVPRLDQLYADEKPELVVVQGDTTSAFCAALAAFHRRIPAAHVEAGLRSFDRFHPYPEEINRRMVSTVTDLHLAPTPSAAQNLLREGATRESVVVTGNTVVDSLLMILAETGTRASTGTEEARTVLITLHRREGWDTGQPGETPLEEILGAIRDAAIESKDVEFVYPVHLNPRVQEPVRRILGGIANVRLIEPVPYLPFVGMMARASAILTDSGGIQEEAPSLGVPVLVLRKTTERPEGVAHGSNRLVGTSAAQIREQLARLLSRPPRDPEQVPHPNPFGDGHASRRIRHAILHFFRAGDPAEEFHPPPPRQGESS